MAKKTARPMRRQDIQFKRSLFRFTLLFVVVFISGLISRIVLHNISVREKILDSVNLPDHYKLNVDEAKVSLRSGWIPVIGVYINRVDLHDRRCPSSKLAAQDIQLRLNPWLMLRGQFQLKRVDVDFLEVSVPQKCGVAVTEATLRPQDSAADTVLAPEEKEKAHSPKLFADGQLQTLFSLLQAQIKNPPFKKLYIPKLHLNIIQSLNRHVVFQGAVELKLEGKVRGELKVDKAFLSDQDLSVGRSKIRFSGDLNQLNINLDSAIREGKALGKLSILNKENYPSKFQGQVKRLPLSAVLKALGGNIELSYLWADCGVEVDGAWRDLGTSNLVFKNCRVDGPYGQVVVNKIAATPQRVEDLDVEVDRIQLDKVMGDKRDFHLSGVFANYGSLSARLAYKSKSWNIQGHLENSEFVFSNNNLSEIQPVNKIPFHVVGGDRTWSASLKKIELENGKFDGEVLIEQKKKSGESRGRIAIHKLLLSPKIYKLMVRSEPAELRVYGKFSLDHQKLRNWSAVLAVPKLKSEFYELNHLKLKGSLGDKGVSQISLTTSDGTIAADGPLLKWLEPTSLQKEWSQDKIEFSELSVRFLLEQNRTLQWKRGYVRLSDGWQFSTEGVRTPRKHVVAWLQWDRPDRKYMRWSFSGKFFEGQWIPQSPWLKQWLDEHPEFLQKHKNISYTVTKKESLTERLNQVGKKAVDRVKKVLKTQSEDAGS